MQTRSQLLAALALFGLVVAGCSSTGSGNGIGSNASNETDSGEPMSGGTPPAKSAVKSPMTPDAPSESAAADSPVKNVVLTGDKMKKDPKDTFAPGDADIYVTFDLDNPKDGDTLRGTLYCDKSAVLAPNVKLAEATLKLTDQLTDGDFHFSKPEKGWPVGDYHVEIHRDQEVASVPFKVAAK